VADGGTEAGSTDASFLAALALLESSSLLQCLWQMQTNRTGLKLLAALPDVLAVRLSIGRRRWLSDGSCFGLLSFLRGLRFGLFKACCEFFCGS